jgi:hypothetical protein
MPARSATSRALRIAVCLTSYNRVDCARISQEIIKLNWPETWYVVHATSDQTYQPYLEDVVVHREPKPLTQGALDLLISAVNAAHSEIPGGVDYVIHLEADTWIADQSVLQAYVDRLAANPDAMIAASAWSYDCVPEWANSNSRRRRLRASVSRTLRTLGLATGIRGLNTISTQFFVAKSSVSFRKALASIHANDGDVLEKLLYAAITKVHGKKAIIGMPEREPVHPGFRTTCDDLTLAAHHWPSAADHPASRPGKKEWLGAQQFTKLGPNMERLLFSTDLQYYNGKASRY